MKLPLCLALIVLAQSDKVPEFVRWLEEQSNVSEVDCNSTLFFTTEPRSSS